MDNTENTEEFLSAPLHPAAAVPDILPMEFNPIYPLERLALHPDNPNEGNVKAIEESLAENGFFGALLVQKSTGFILAGNTTYRAAKAKGMAGAPTLLIDVPNDVALNILLADNATAEKGKRNQFALAGLLRGIEENRGTISGTGYTADDMTNVLFAIGGSHNAAGESRESIKAASKARKAPKTSRRPSNEPEGLKDNPAVVFYMSLDDAAKVEDILLRLAERFQQTDKEQTLIRALEMAEIYLDSAADNKAEDLLHGE